MSSRAILVAALAALAFPGSASALKYDAFVAAGEGTTNCLVREHINDRPFSDRFEWDATTECTAPVEQRTEAWWWGETIAQGAWNDYGGVCSGVTTSCALSGGNQGEYHGGTIDHHIRLRAPRGQGWIVAPEVCSGIGTDLVDCWL